MYHHHQLLSVFCLLSVLSLSSLPAVAEKAGPALSAEQRLLLSQWSAFCDALKATGQRIVALDRGQPIDTAEGFHYLAMLTGMAIERTQGYQIASHPQLYRNLDTYKKIGLDSSDNTYRVAKFEPGGVYRIRGWRGNSTYLGFQVNQGISAVGNLNHKDMQFNEDGSFELYLGGEPRDGNWLALPAGADSMYVREIFIDWQHEQPSPMWLERLDLQGPPAPLDAGTVAGRLEQITDFVSRQVEFWNGYMERARARTNQLAAPTATTGEGGSADNLYSGGAFQVAEDEALIIETGHVETLFWSVQLGNNWFQSLDYRYRQTSLNSAQAHRDSDGRYRVVIAHRDPGVPNWLDTAGHSEGVVYYRWNQAATQPGAPVIKRVKLAELRRHLPADTPVVSSAQRREVLTERAHAVARRFAY